MKVQKRDKDNGHIRFLLGTILPTPIGTLIFLMLQGDLNLSSIFDPVFIIVIMVALVLVGLPSAIYSIVMEHLVNPKISSNVAAVVISSLLGFISGLVVGFPIVGLLVGIVLGFNFTLLIRYLT